MFREDCGEVNLTQHLHSLVSFLSELGSPFIFFEKKINLFWQKLVKPQKYFHSKVHFLCKIDIAVKEGLSVYLVNAHLGPARVPLSEMYADNISKVSFTWIL